jgi:proton-dependent oligopeptide transporter, POT family
MKLSLWFNKDRDKHPKELFVLALCGMSLRYAFWGVGNLLVLYLLDTYKMNAVQATHIFGLFTGLASFLPLLGGFVADKWNYHGPIFLGIIASAVGCFLISIGNVFFLYIALLLIAVGYGIFVPSIFAILSHTYRNKPNLRQSGFSLYYSSFNIGVFLAMLSIGFIAHIASWSFAYFIAGIVQLSGLIPAFWYYKKYHLTYKNIHPKDKKQFITIKHSLNKIEKDRIIVILILCILPICFWAAYSQGWSSMSIFILHFTEKKLFNFTIPIAWILALESLFLILLAPILAKLYSLLQKRKKDPSPIIKSSLSMLSISLTFLVMMLISIKLPPHATNAAISPLYLILVYFLMALGEMLIAPVGLSLVTNLSPKRYTGLLVGFWYVCVGLSFYIGGVLAGLISSIGLLFDFFAIFFLITIIPCIILLLFSKKLNAMRHIKKL